MLQPKILAWGLFVGAVLFIVAALVGIAQGEKRNAVLLGVGAAFFGIALTFVGLSLARPKKAPPPDPPPPAA